MSPNTDQAFVKRTVCLCFLQVPHISRPICTSQLNLCFCVCALGRSTLDVWKGGPRKVNMGRPTILRDDGSGGQAEIIIRVHIHPGSHLLPTSLYPQGFLCLPSPSFSANLSIVPHNFLFTGQRLTCRRESRLEFIIVFSSERGAYQVMVAPIAFIFIYAKTANEKIRGASCR